MEGARQIWLELVTWPLKVPAVLLLIVFALAGGLLVLFVRASMDLFPLNVLLLVPGFYGVTGALALGAQLTFTRLARGQGTEARPGDADLNPFTSAQAFRHGLLLALALGVLLLFDNVVALAIFAVIHVTLYLAVGLEESLLGGLRPAFVARVVDGLNLSYLVLAVLLGGSVLLLCEVLLNQSPALLGPAALVYLLCHGFGGWIVYLHRNRLELHTEESPEQAQAAAQLAEARAIDVLLEEAHRQCASGQLAKAVAGVDAYLSEGDYALDPMLHERLRDFDERLFLEHAVRYIERLAARGEHRKAWAIVREGVDRDERFRPLNAATLLATTQVAGREDARIVAELLADFASAYEDSELGAEALFRRARIHLELLGAGETGLALLRELERDFPAFARGNRFRRYRARLRLQPSG